MAKALRAVAVVAGIVALSFAIPGVGTAIGASLGLSISAGTAATIAAAASVVSSIASAGAQMLQKPPDMKGTINEVVIGANMPVPYGMGRTYVGGMKVYDDSAHTNNYDRTFIIVGSHAGPIDSFEKFLADYTEITFASHSGGLISGKANGWYGDDGGYLWINSRKGARPDTALTAPAGRGAFRNWGANHKLSGMASWSITMEFDEDGKRWSGGIPAFGMVGKWVLAYDPRQDSTYPGGSGTQRWDNEASWTWSQNAGVHALTYARGRYMGPNNLKVAGIGLPKTSIDLPAFVELMNVCDANGWTMGGFVYEGPGLSKWDNLKRILDAAAAKPVWVGGVLTLVISAPRVALDIVTMDDIAEGEIVIPAMSAWKDKFNTIVPRYRSESHRWEYVQAEAIVNSTYLAEDGESKTDERQYDLIQNVNVVAERAAYDLVNDREFGPIELPLKPRLRLYRPGEALELNLPELGLTNQLAVITSRTLDPSTASVRLELYSETAAKHAYALGQTGVAPPTPSIVTPQEIDEAVTDSTLTQAQITQLIAQSYVTGLTFTVDSVGEVVISSHNRVYGDKAPVAVSGNNLSTGADPDDLILIYYDDPERAGGAVVYQALLIDEGVGETGSAFASDTNPYRHFVAVKKVPTSGTTGGGSGAGFGGGGSMPGGGGGLLNYT